MRPINAGRSPLGNLIRRQKIQAENENQVSFSPLQEVKCSDFSLVALDPNASTSAIIKLGQTPEFTEQKLP
jgi:hypothetical protein